ncbi:unnamed protein product [Effrenium voratum]|uniref:FH2 domain-containing protein n=1 Tax=Effrenium voratum TaxID=2562239 RepID=A0AA36HMQ6_9DINO|nr:unnamed protein product [Effrenium voratum]CAJ1371938.1 unnamed protein product [Effrenium voratum]
MHASLSSSSRCVSRLSLPQVSASEGADELEAWLVNVRLDGSLTSCEEVAAAGRQLGDQAFSRFVASLLSASVELARRLPQAAGFKILCMDFSGNRLTERAAAALAECLAWMREHFGGHVLTSLNLSDNQIGPAGAEELAIHFFPQQGTREYELGLSSNPLGDVGARGVASAIQRRRCPAVLHLRAVGLGQNGCRSLMECAPMLKALDLRGNEIAEAELRALAAKLPEPLRLLPQLDLHPGRAAREPEAKEARAKAVLQRARLALGERPVEPGGRQEPGAVAPRDAKASSEVQRCAQRPVQHPLHPVPQPAQHVPMQFHPIQHPVQYPASSRQISSSGLPAEREPPGKTSSAAKAALNRARNVLGRKMANGCEMGPTQTVVAPMQAMMDGPQAMPSAQAVLPAKYATLVQQAMPAAQQATPVQQQAMPSVQQEVMLSEKPRATSVEQEAMPSTQQEVNFPEKPQATPVHQQAMQAAQQESRLSQQQAMPAAQWKSLVQQQAMLAAQQEVMLSEKPRATFVEQEAMPSTQQEVNFPEKPQATPVHMQALQAAQQESALSQQQAMPAAQWESLVQQQTMLAVQQEVMLAENPQATVQQEAMPSAQQEVMLSQEKQAKPLHQQAMPAAQRESTLAQQQTTEQPEAMPLAAPAQQQASAQGQVSQGLPPSDAYERACLEVSSLQSALRQLEGGLGCPREAREREPEAEEPDAEALAMPERTVRLEREVAELREDVRRIEHTVTSLQAEPEQEDVIESRLWREKEPEENKEPEEKLIDENSCSIASIAALKAEKDQRESERLDMLRRGLPCTDTAPEAADSVPDAPDIKPLAAPEKPEGLADSPTTAKAPPKGKGKGKGPPLPAPKASPKEGPKGGKSDEQTENSAKDEKAPAALQLPPPAKGKGKGKGKGGKGGPPAPPAKGPAPKSGPLAKAAAPKAESKAPFHKRLYWKQVDIDAEGTIFSESRSRANTVGALDFSALSRILEAEKTKGSQLQRRSSGVLSKAQMRNVGTKVLSDHRARNMAIVLKRMPTSTGDLVAVLRALRWEEDRISSDDLEQILEAIPTQEEAKKLREHSEPEACQKLRDVEQMVMPLTQLTRASARVRVLCIARNARPQFKATMRSLARIRAACSAIQRSGMLRNVMVLALQLGNFINTGDSKKGAKAIAISSLLALRDFKCDGISSLHFLCFSLIQSKADAAQTLLRELQPAEKIAKMQVQGLSAAMKSFARDLETIKSECQNFVAEYEGEDCESTACGSAEDDDKDFGEELAEVQAVAAAAACDLLESPLKAKADEDATRWVEDVMKIRGSAQRRLRCMRRILEKLYNLLKADMESTAEQVHATLRFCGVQLKASQEVPPDLEALLSNLSEFTKVFKEHWDEVKKNMSHYQRLFSDDAAQ